MNTEELYSIYRECGGTVTTDSRTLKGGELFIALKGENFDGNEYALQALDKGAAYAVVQRGSAAAESGNPRIIVVDDCMESLRDLARHHRRNCIPGGHLTVIGLTGTNGKTTTKELIKSVLGRKYKVSATEGNLNNDIGVPLSLLKIREDTGIAVIEMGASHPDDILHLVEVCEPDCGLVTNVGTAHLLGFGSFEGVRKAKGQLYDFIAGNGGEVFVNVDDPTLLEMAQERKGLSIIPYGVRYGAAKLLPITPEHPFLRLVIDGREIETKLVGAYNAMNVVAAICVGCHFEVPFEDAVTAIEEYVPANKRSQMIRTGRNTIIMDAYNANPSSMEVALDSFSMMQASRKIAMLGDMRELGEGSFGEHLRTVNRIASDNFEAFLVGEEFGKALETRGRTPNILGHFDTSDDLVAYLAENPIEGACVLVKGSRGIRMEKVEASL